MSYTVAVLLGLGAALGFGVGDLCARTAGRHVGSLRAMLFGGIQGLVLLSLWLLLHRSSWPGGASPRAWSVGVFAGFLNLVATAALFRAFATGKLALVSPVIASYGAVTVVLSLLSGESVSWMRAAGVVLAIGGVALASAVPADRGAPGTSARPGRFEGGLGWALVAAGGYGTTFWVLGRFAVPELGGFVPVWLYYIVEVIVLVGVALATGTSLRLPAHGQMLPVLGNGVVIAAAYVSFAVGLESGEIGIVTVLSSLSSAVTVLGAALFLGERLIARQWIGAAGILAGVLLINGG